MEADPARAVNQYSRTIDEGDSVYSANRVGSMLADAAEEEVCFHYRSISSLEVIRAVILLAMLLEDGAEGVDADPTRAVELYTRAIDEGGNVTAMLRLAFLFEKGALGVDPDPAQAVDLYTRAIDDGADTNAMNNLANLLKEGAAGVDANSSRAAEPEPTLPL